MGGPTEKVLSHGKNQSYPKRIISSVSSVLKFR
jgi:hypothetical protein